MERLLEAILDEARAEERAIRDRASNEARGLVSAAEEAVEELTRAARDLGRARGALVDRSAEREADAEIARVRDTALDALAERFLARVRRALEDLPRGPRYGEALRAWARRAAAAAEGPTEVFARPQDRQAVYDALLAAGARDFRVLADHGIRCGFVVRDLDGRTRMDARPAALVGEREASLRALLRRRVPAFVAPP